jgi:integrase
MPDDAPRKKRQTYEINETLREKRLSRPFGRLFTPSVTWDSGVRGFCLIVTTRRAFWALVYQPRGRNPRTGKRWGGGVRHEIADAHEMSVKAARAAAMTALGVVRNSGDPHRDAMASRASAEASRSIIPTTVAEALDAYAKALAARTTPKEQSRRHSVHYARKAVRLMQAEATPLAAINVRMVRLLLETMLGSQAERRQVYGGLSRFLTWCRRQQLIERNPCDDLDRDERPKPGKARANVPSLEELRAIWDAVEGETASVRDMVRLLLLTALRRDEVADLPWSEVDLVKHRLVIPGERMKNEELHEVPLAAQALALLKARMPANPSPRELVFPSSVGKPIANWGPILTRIRKAIDEAHLPKAQRFVFHDVRRSFTTLLSDDFDVDALDRAIAHKRSGTAGGYNYSTRMATRAQVFAMWADLLLGEAAPLEAAPDNVVPLPRRAHV